MKGSDGSPTLGRLRDVGSGGGGLTATQKKVLEDREHVALAHNCKLLNANIIPIDSPKAADMKPAHSTQHAAASSTQGTSWLQPQKGHRGTTQGDWSPPPSSLFSGVSFAQSSGENY